MGPCYIDLDSRFSTFDWMSRPRHTSINRRSRSNCVGLWGNCNFIPNLFECWPMPRSNFISFWHSSLCGTPDGRPCEWECISRVGGWRACADLKDHRPVYLLAPDVLRRAKEKLSRGCQKRPAAADVLSCCVLECIRWTSGQRHGGGGGVRWVKRKWCFDARFQGRIKQDQASDYGFPQNWKLEPSGVWCVKNRATNASVKKVGFLMKLVFCW